MWDHEEPWEPPLWVPTSWEPNGPASIRSGAAGRHQFGALCLLSRRDELVQLVSECLAWGGAGGHEALVPRLLVDQVLAPEFAAGEMGDWPPEPGAVVVGLPGEGSMIQATCEQMGWRGLELPLGSAWLCDWATRLESDAPTSPPATHPEHPGRAPARQGKVVGVLGGSGGCGSSTTALAIALAASARLEVLLVDADPLGAGLGPALGIDPADDGWTRIDSQAESIDDGSLVRGLPRDDRLWMLTGPAPDSPTPQALPAVLSAARRGFDLTVVDLPRGPAGLARALEMDEKVLVVAATLPGVLAAQRLLRCGAEPAPTLSAESTGSWQLVVRGSGRLPHSALERHLGNPVRAHLPDVRLVAERWQSGELLQGRSRRKLTSWGRQIMAAWSGPVS